MQHEPPTYATAPLKSSTHRGVSGPKTAGPPKFREARFEDYEGIAQLATRYALPPEPRERWERLWTGNPAYTPGMPIGWVLEHSGKLVGWIASIPLQYELEGDLVRTVSPRSWVVDQRFRAFTTLLGDAFLHQPNIDLVVSTTGNEEGSAALAAVGAKPVPQRIKPEAAIWITEYRGFAVSYLRLKGWSRQAGVLAQAAAAGASILDAFRPGLRHARAVQREAEVGAEFDNFWRELRLIRRQTLLGRRDRAALGWHFGTTLRDGRAWLFTSHDKGRMSSYAVFQRYDNPELGLRRMVLADFQQLDGVESSFGAMLKSAYDESRREGIHCIAILGSRLESSEIVQKLLPYKRSMPQGSLPYLYAASKALERQLRDDNRWDITLFDGDSSLCPTEIEPSHKSSSNLAVTA